MLSTGTVFAPLKIALFGLFLLQSACLSVGLPEYVSPGAAGDSGVGYEEPARNAIPLDFRARLLSSARGRAPWILLELPGRALAPAEDPRGLGHQFLLGFIPFTKVYLQHDPESLLLETAIEYFSLQGFRVALFTPPARTLLARSFGSAFVVRMSVPRLRVNAFDLLILRLADVDGDLNLDVASSTAPEVTIKSIRKPIEANEYRKFAHAPALAAMLERNLNAAVAKAGAELPTLRRLRASKAAGADAAGPAAPILTSPRFLKPPAAGMGTALAASYGFQSRPAFANTALLRIVQRGLETGAAASGLPVISVPHGGAPHGAKAGEIIDTGILRLEPAEDGLSADIQIGYRSGRSAVCTVRAEAPGDMDGGLVVALERAAAAALQVFLHGGENISSVACSDR